MSETALLAGLFEAVPVASFLVDGDGTVLLANRLARGMVQQTAEEIAVEPRRGGDLLGCVHAHDVPEGCGRGPACGTCDLRGLVGQALSLGRAAHRELTLTLHSGVVPARASAAPVPVNGEPMVVLALAPSDTDAFGAPGPSAAAGATPAP